MLKAIKRRYKRSARKFYRFLRSPKLRKYKWLQKIVTPMFERQYWQPSRRTVAKGLAIGLFASQLPIPGQMILAAIWAVSLRGYIPIAIAGCWITNPITQVFAILLQEQFGDFLRKTLHIPVHPFIEGIQIPLDTLGLEQQSFSIGSFILGFLALGFLLSLLAFPVVYLISALFPKIIPKNPILKSKKNLAQVRTNEPPST